MNDAHYRKLENMYHQAPVNSLYGNRLTVSEGASQIVWEVDARFFHAMSALHGSAYFKLLDDAAFFAANSLVEDAFVLTASFHIHFLRPIVGGTVRAEGAIVSAGRNLLVAEAALFDDNDDECATGSGTFAHSRIPLTEEIGYR